MIATLGDTPFHYVESGKQDATPVLFLHGFPFSHAMWQTQLELIAPEFRGIAYDLRGHGASYVGDGQYTIEGHVDDLMAFLDYLKLRKVIIIGLSMGGYITLRAMERDPERFSAAVLCDTRSEADGNEGKLKRAAAIALVKEKGPAEFAEGFLRNVFAQATFKNNPEAVEKIRRIIHYTPALSIAGTLLALAGRTDTTESLESIRVPTCILVGEHDITTPPAASKAMHDRIHGSELHIIPGAAHMSNLENPTVFNDTLLAFLRRVTTHNS